MLYFDWYTFLIGLVILSVLLLVLWRRKHDLSYLLCFSAFWVYLMLVLKETIFPIPLGCGGSSYIFRVSVNWIPFYFGERAATEAILRGVVLNTLLTLPFGFGISFVMRVRFSDMLWQPLSVGLGIEALQLVISAIVRCGYRVIDVNDVIFNASRCPDRICALPDLCRLILLGDQGIGHPAARAGSLFLQSGCPRILEK